MAWNGGIGRIATAVAAVFLASVALRRTSSAEARSHREDYEYEDSRGRSATGPTEIPATGWKDILWRTYAEMNNDRVLLVAAGVTFYGLLALFPALTAFVSIYGFFADPQSVVEHVGIVSGFLPEGAVEIVSGQMERIATQPTDRLSLGFIFGLGIALWSANNGMKAIFDATNVAYNEEEKRSFIRLNAVSLLFTLGAIAVLLMAIAAIVVLPIVLGFVGLGQAAEATLRILRWPVLLLIIITGISLIYRYGPSRARAKWRWISPGSVIASFGWIIASLLFSWYVANFDTYNETYGSLGAVIAFMVWMWVSATIIIMGAELNSEMEHQTARDSTTGDRKPMGARGAHMADTLGRRAGSS